LKFRSFFFFNKGTWFRPQQLHKLFTTTSRTPQQLCCTK
jgi:hypothetical protein